MLLEHDKDFANRRITHVKRHKITDSRFDGLEKRLIF